MLGDDFRIVSDTVTDGVRHITAVPSALVCSVQIDFDLSPDGKIHQLKYIRGCNGNLQAIGHLLEGKDATAEYAAATGDAADADQILSDQGSSPRLRGTPRH